MARDAEVLPQHVAGEDVGAHHVLDGVAVLHDDGGDLLGRRVLQVDVERDHAPLDVGVADEDRVALLVEGARAEVAQLVQQRLVEPIARKADVAVFERVGHPPDPVVLLDQQVLALDQRPRGLLRRRIEVLDDLEDVREAGQVEHQHHHALDAGRDPEAVGRMAHVRQEVPVEEALALLLQAERAVDLRAGLPRHQRAQEGDVGRRHFHGHHEVGPCEAEHELELVLAEQGGVDRQRARFAVDDRQSERRLDEAVDDLADDVGALVAEEQRRQHLDLEVGPHPELAEPLVDGLGHRVDVALQILESAIELEVGDDAEPGGAQRLAGRVVGAIGRQRGRLVVLDVLGRDGRADEDEVVAVVAAVQDARRHRVEEGLGQLRLVVLDQQADVVQLGLLPCGQRQVGGRQRATQVVDRVGDAGVVVLDAQRLGPLLAVPVRRLEALPRVGTGLAEQAVVAIETFQHGGRDGDAARLVERVDGDRIVRAGRRRAHPRLRRPPRTARARRRWRARTWPRARRGW